MASNVGNVPWLMQMIVTHTVCMFKIASCVWPRGNFLLQLMTIGLLNTEEFQNFLYQDHGIFRTSTSISHKPQF